MKSFNFKKVLSVSFASLTVLSGFCGLNSVKVSAAPLKKTSTVISKPTLTMEDLSELIDYNPDVNFAEKQNDIKCYISKHKDLMKEDSNRDAWYRSIVTFSEILFTKFKNSRGCLGFNKVNMVILATFYELYNISIFDQINSIREILLNKGSEEAKLGLCSKIVEDFMKSERLI